MSRRGGSASVNQRMQSTVRRPSPRPSPRGSPVKNGNGVNRKPQQQRVSVKKLHTQENRNTSNNNNSTLIGASGVSLSERFSQLKDQVLAQDKSTTHANTNSNANGGRPSAKAKAAALLKQREQQKLKQVAQANRAKRQQIINKHRPGLKVVPATNNSNGSGKKPSSQTAKQNTRIQVKPGVVVRKNQRNSAVLAARKMLQRRGGRTGTIAGRGGGGRGGGQLKTKTEKPKTGEELDTEMDTYWFKAGKGPDPEAAKLDRQMEQYWAAKPESGNESSPAGTSTSS